MENKMPMENEIAWTDDLVEQFGLYLQKYYVPHGRDYWLLLVAGGVYTTKQLVEKFKRFLATSGQI